MLPWLTTSIKAAQYFRPPPRPPACERARARAHDASPTHWYVPVEPRAACSYGAAEPPCVYVCGSAPPASVGSGQPVVLLLHGNAHDLRGADGDALVLTFARGLRAPVFALDYTGYGLSDGAAPSAPRDCAAVFRWLRESTAAQRSPIVVMGVSLGSALAALTAAAVADGGRLGGVVLARPLASAAAVADAVLRDSWLRAVARAAAGDDLDAAAALSALRQRRNGGALPILVAASDGDTVLPARVAEPLAAHASAVLRMAGDHNDPLPPQFWAAARRVLGAGAAAHTASTAAAV
jgi:pimeloyl-ACP methyl ester carboxylesterase